jgi:integrase
MAAIPLPGAPGSEEFMQAYGAALATSSAPEIGANRTAPGTIGALRAAYFSSAAWLDLPEDTRRNRRPIIDRFCDRNHDKRVALLQRRHIEALLKDITAGPATKDYWLRTIRALLGSGIPNVIKENPTAGIKVKRVKTPGHRPWTAEQIAQYRAYWALGTQQRLTLEFALESASRRGEIVNLGPQHVYRGPNGEWRIKIARLKGSNDVDLPITPELLAAVNAMPKDHLRFITSGKGEPITKKTFGRYFAEWATEAGLPKHCRLHGLKKNAMTQIVLAGATAPMLMKVSGHKDMAVAQKYIEEAFVGPELADEAFARLENKRRLGVTPDYTNTPQQLHKRPAKPLKSQRA